MKGLVFREFIDLVEAKFGDDIVDEIIEAADLPSGGAYTAVGTYPHREMVSLVVELSRAVELPVDTLLDVFGHYLATDVFANKYASFFTEAGTTIEMLKKVEDHIHIEVMKLYPDAELPSFVFVASEDNRHEFRYESSRDMAPLADGLIKGTAAVFEETIEVEYESHVNDGAKFTRFFVTTPADGT